jgi:hypothetical protein
LEYSCLKYVPIGVERDHAFLGFAALLQQNPSQALSSKKSIILACVSWQEPPTDPQLQGVLAEILLAIKGHDEVAWRAIVSSLEFDLKSRLVDNFRISL